jgi:hypothetical protein
MRKIVVSEYVSLDGVMQDPGGVGELEHGSWTVPYWSDELAAFKHDELFRSDGVLLGRVTYEGFAAAWPTATDEGDYEEHRHLDAQGALGQLERLLPDGEDVVVCHGDYCPPNALIRDGRVTAYVDLGELGVADPWWDLAVATGAITWNFGPGLEPLFLSVYGAPPDPQRQAFYRLLYDVAS